MQELWKKIDGYENYSVSNTGKVRNDTNGYIMQQRPNNKGYLMVSLSNHGKSKNCTVHRLVAKAFVPNPDNKPQVNHIDEDKNNNTAENLNWMTNQENAVWGTHVERVSKANSLFETREEYEAYRKKYKHDYHLAHKEERAEYSRKYQAEHKEQIKAYREAHKEEKKAYYKKYYAEHQEQIKVYLEIHKEEIRARRKKYYAEHKKRQRT